jgi:AcrR family transcriptional regulator
MVTGHDMRIDGRAQRSERSRAAIVQALLELIGEGILEPTAQQVAERADVGVRTVFRHFSDMETLFATMHERVSDDVESLFVSETQTGPLEQRIDALIERRLTIFRVIAPFKRAGAVQRWRSPFLQDQHKRNIRILRRDLDFWLPELTEAEGEIADSVALVLSFESWDQLRIDQGLGPKRARAALHRMTRTLMSRQAGDSA